MINRPRAIRICLLWLAVALCFFGFVIQRHSEIFRQYESVLFSLQKPLVLCLAAWAGAFIALTFQRKDFFLAALLAVGIVRFLFVSEPRPDAAPIVLLTLGIALGKIARFLFIRPQAPKDDPGRFFLPGLVFLLAFCAWWHLDMPDNFYRGPRWTGLWDNPNGYGQLMSAGTLLSGSFFVAAVRDGRRERGTVRPFWHCAFLICFLMLSTGLFFSYSRGSWIGMIVALVYLACNYRRLSWRLLLPFALLIAAGIFYCWHAPESSPWYVKRMDLGRPSAQHRVAAWSMAGRMMRDHPFGLGWNKAVNVYEEDYHAPVDAAAALTTNDYLMLGTELGLPALFCFLAYAVAVFFPGKKKPIESAGYNSQQFACRAAALSLLISFWFDAGLFHLPTTVLFWVLLELGGV